MSASPPTNPGSDTGLSSNVASVICAAVFPPILGIIFYFIEKKDQLVRHWAVQSTFFGCTWIVFWIVYTVLAQILIHIPILGWLVMGILYLALLLGGFVLWLLGVIYAFQGNKWEYPIISEQC